MDDDAKSAHQVSVLPMNSAVLVFERDSPEFLTAIQAPKLQSCIFDILEDMRQVVKWGIQNSSTFDFSELDKHNISQDTIRAVVDVVRSSMYKEFSNRGIDVEG